MKIRLNSASVEVGVEVEAELGNIKPKLQVVGVALKIEVIKIEVIQN